MDYVTTSVGLGLVLYGHYTLYLRSRAPEKFGKLEAMQGFWGSTGGKALHIFAYTIFPIGLGGWLLYAGTQGVSLLEAIP